MLCFVEKKILKMSIDTIIKLNLSVGLNAGGDRSHNADMESRRGRVYY